MHSLRSFRRRQFGGGCPLLTLDFGSDWHTFLYYTPSPYFFLTRFVVSWAGVADETDTPVPLGECCRPYQNAPLCCAMLTADALARHDTVFPVLTASSSSFSSSLSSRSSRVGVPRDVSGHSSGYTAKLDSATKWVHAAFRHLQAAPIDLMLQDGSPNNPLASRLHSLLADWYISATTARDAGVHDDRESELRKTPPREILVNARNWMRRHINSLRTARGIEDLPERWGAMLAGRRGDSRTVNRETTRRKRNDGSLYHHKHDVAPSQDQLTAMTRCGFVADPHIAADVLDALEAPMAIGLYLSTGARGSELKTMHLQSLGHELIEDAASGLAYDCLKLTAFETKTKQQHMNMILAHVDPWRCGIGLLGLSLLVRIERHGFPPVSMATHEGSWRVLGTNADTLDKRIKDAFGIAGLRRQLGDPVTYLGRHFGTRLLQHAGGTSEGGAARTGHASRSARETYTECPLPDLRRIAGRDVVSRPAHLHPDAMDAARRAVDVLVPAFREHETRIQQRQQDILRLGRERADRVRTEEQLNDLERLLRALRYLCEVALCCVVARPRTWKRWEMLPDRRSIWETRNESRVVAEVVGEHPCAQDALTALHVVVRRCEDAERMGRMAAVDASTTQVTEVVNELRRESALRDERILHALTAIRPDANPPPNVLPPEPAAPSVKAPSHHVRLKRPRVEQHDVVPFAHWTCVHDALTYAMDTLVPLEREHGRAWRVKLYDDHLQHGKAHEDKSRDAMWRKYVALAAAVGMRETVGTSRADAVRELQATLDATNHTQLCKVCREAHTKYAAAVLGLVT